MSEKIRKRRQEIKVSKSFEERNYKTLDFLNRISTLLEEPGSSVSTRWSTEKTVFP